MKAPGPVEEVKELLRFEKMYKTVLMSFNDLRMRHRLIDKWYKFAIGYEQEYMTDWYKWSKQKWYLHYIKKINKHAKIKAILNGVKK